MITWTMNGETHVVEPMEYGRDEIGEDWAMVAITGALSSRYGQAVWVPVRALDIRY